MVESKLGTRTRVRKAPYRTRQLMQPPVTRVISVTSGKGGVGKTHTVVNLGIALASRGKSVLLLDADLGLANIDVLLNLKPKANLHDVLKGSCTLDDVILEGPGGISLIPAASGVESLTTLSANARLVLLEAVEEVAYRYDYLLIDTGAGIGPDVLCFNGASAEIVCVVNPEPTSLTDSYALMKVLSTSCGEKRFSILVNEAESENEARRTYATLSGTVDRHLNVSTRYLGAIPDDRSVRECIMRRVPIVTELPSGPVARAFTTLADRIDSEEGAPRIKGGMQMFFRQLLDVGAYGVEAGC